jgi:membrane fusion protein, heavy metal efflux system
VHGTGDGVREVMKMGRCFFLFSICAVGFGCERNHPGKSQQTPPLGELWIRAQDVAEADIKVEPAEVRRVATSITTSGKVVFDDEKVQHVFSPVTGRVTKILAKPGQRIRRGDALAVIDSPDLGLALADVGKAAADYSAAEHDYNRQKRLFEQRAVGQRDFEQAEDTFLKAKAELDRSRQKAKLLRVDGQTAPASGAYTLRALIDGEVIGRTINPGIEVLGQYAGGVTLELFTIGAIDRVWVMADIYEMDLARVRADAKVAVSVVSYPGHEFTGKVDFLSDAIDPSTRTTVARASLDNPDHLLKPGMFATVRIVAEGRDALAVPQSSVLRQSGQPIVYVALGPAPDGRQRFARRPVLIEEVDGEQLIEIRRGLNPGENIVTNNAVLLSGM